MLFDLTQLARMPPTAAGKQQRSGVMAPVRSQTVMDKRPGTQENPTFRQSRSASEPAVFNNGR